jgi:hypothetical protein
MALCLSSCSSHSLLFNVLEAAAQSGEDGLPAYENLWEQPSPEETQKALSRTVRAVLDKRTIVRGRHA